ncbi:uncharacterized protein N7482_006196 [Penicillium canariense]|uniref:Uncharacterized protein n=1 Tax=Penicillium canariense TaxID=189055 RepID=A0A9W9I3T8_9EURO|nr:uncharacterized protein N7482_006196 [Penicillium canariense]KAJ5167415.1 hypothetical protein N7482_006196 [Penicillium canariense]
MVELLGQFIVSTVCWEPGCRNTIEFAVEGYGLLQGCPAPAGCAGRVVVDPGPYQAECVDAPDKSHG